MALGCAQDDAPATTTDGHSATEPPPAASSGDDEEDSVVGRDGGTRNGGTRDASTPDTSLRDASAGPKEVSPAKQDELDLLTTSHARSFMDIFCERKPDDEKIPDDPRRLIRPGFNKGKNVAFNAYWQDCDGKPGPTTCGQYRSEKAAGRKLIEHELAPSAMGMGMSASGYANAWKNWDGANLSARPSNYDDQAGDRYGFPKAPFPNPYPLEGEDPNKTNGGSGQLPLGFTQLRDESGKWTGNISMTCEVCHSSTIEALGQFGGDAYVPGMGALTSDLQLLMTDMATTVPIGMNDSRGVTNAMGLSALIVGMFDQDSLGVRLDTLLLLQLPGNTSGSGDTKSPPWWNVSHRPRKFWDGGYSTDAVRMDSAILNVPSAFASPLGNDRKFNHDLRAKVEGDSIVIQTYIESLTSPVYPFPIDKELAKQGSLLFHSKDLWAGDVNKDIPRPPSNGSCAGCHGAYAPLFANDPAFLDDPRVMGMAGYVAPLDMIRTDPERQHGFTSPILEMMSTGWLSYPEKSPGYISPDDKPGDQEVTDDFGLFTPGTREPGACTWQGYLPGDVKGYLAPPLHGIWATGPYLHNASLPDIWSVLSPDQRPAVWRRKLTEGNGSEHGQDTSRNAYDTEKLGWKYDKLVCGESSSRNGEALVDCEPTEPTNPFQELATNVQKGAGTIN
ncbi:MAG TPA: hypothetical protein VI299_20190, partial [Polyangiales bacterium]